MLLEGKNAVITGCSRGIGREIAQKFYLEGANLWVCARKPNENFEQWISQLQKFRTKGWIKAIYFDLLDQNERKQAIQKILQEKQTIDILVNNAGIAYTGTLHMTPLKNLEEIFEINYFAAIELIQLISRKMIRQKDGVILNIASVGGIEAREGYLAYGSSKAALIWATRCIARELAPYGIRVNAIAPGLVETEMGHTKSPEELQKTIQRTAMHRMGQPEEIADAALFLVSKKASFITGQILKADGGRT